MDAFGPSASDAEGRGHGGVDAARHGDDHLGETVLLDVVAEAELERRAHLVELGSERGDGAGDLVELLERGDELDLLDDRRVLARAVEVAAPCVSQTPPDRGDGLDVDDEEVLLETRRAGDDLAGVVQDDRVPVEDELVLAAHEVAEREVGARVARPGDEHLLPLLGLADVERRRGEVDDELRSREREVGRRGPGLPDVLADRDPDEASPSGRTRVRGRRRSSGARRTRRSSAGSACGRRPERARRRTRHTRCEVAVEPGRADERHDAVRRRGDLLERLSCGAHEARAEEEVLGRVAR